MPAYPISEPSSTNSAVNMLVGDTLQLSITSQCKVCCNNPGIFTPFLPNGALLNPGFQGSYQATQVGTAQVSTVAANANCLQISAGVTRSVHVSAGVERHTGD